MKKSQKCSTAAKEPAKKKPGRPRKVQESKKSTKEIIKTEGLSVTGEPKSKSKSEQAKEPAKKKPGRPRKVQEPVKIQKQSKIQEPAKRKPGRPRKVQEPQKVTIKTKKGTKIFMADKEAAKQRKKTKKAALKTKLNDPTRLSILKYYNVSKNGTIQSPGKFEGEMLYMPYFFGIFLEGGAEDTGKYVKVEVDDNDRLIFPELGNKKFVKFDIYESGFVCEI